MASPKFVIVDNNGQYFAKNQPGCFTGVQELASWWQSAEETQKALVKLATKPAVKDKFGQLTVQEIVPLELQLDIDAEKNNVAADAVVPSQEELFDLLEKFCKLAVDIDSIKSQLAQRVKDANGADIDLLHLLELGKMSAATRSEMVKEWKESRLRRRKDKDCWLAINALFPEGAGKIRPNAEKCLNLLDTLKNQRSYTFRNEEIGEKFGVLLP